MSDNYIKAIRDFISNDLEYLTKQIEENLIQRESAGDEGDYNFTLGRDIELNNQKRVLNSYVSLCTSFIGDQPIDKKPDSSMVISKAEVAKMKWEDT